MQHMPATISQFIGLKRVFVGYVQENGLGFCGQKLRQTRKFSRTENSEL